MSRGGERRTLSMQADRLGIIASVLCFIHCVFTPLAVALLAVGAHCLPSEEKVHRVLAVFVATLGGLAIFFGYRRHRRSPVVVLMSVGLCLIFAGAYLGSRCRHIWRKWPSQWQAAAS